MQFATTLERYYFEKYVLVAGESGTNSLFPSVKRGILWVKLITSF